MKRTPLARGPAPRRKVGVRKVNKKRAAMKYARNFGEHAATIRELPCEGCGMRPPSDPAHAIGRKAGGCGGDKTKLVPLCKDFGGPLGTRVGCHTLYDEHLSAFTARTGLTREDVVARARELWETRGERGGR